MTPGGKSPAPITASFAIRFAEPGLHFRTATELIRLAAVHQVLIRVTALGPEGSSPSSAAATVLGLCLLKTKGGDPLRIDCSAHPAAIDRFIGRLEQLPVVQSLTPQPTGPSTSPPR